MHATAEIVIPPTKDIKAAISQVMDYFRDEDGDGNQTGRASWWDFWVIGGRFSGTKLQARLDPAKLDAFHEELNRRKVTVSGLTCGKQELSPASQIPMVDALWRESFPGCGDKCPLFNHSNDQYGRDGSIAADDVCTVADIPERLECARLIVACPSRWRDSQPLEPVRHLAAEFWNNVEHQKTDFDGNVKKAMVAMLAEEPNDRGFKKSGGVAPEWLVVTVDYHN